MARRKQRDDTPVRVTWIPYPRHAPQPELHVIVYGRPAGTDGPLDISHDWLQQDGEWRHHELVTHWAPLTAAAAQRPHAVQPPPENV